MPLTQLRAWLNELLCACLPIEIPDSENVIRAIYYEVHLSDSGSLKWQAFDSTPGTDEVSIMRSARLSPTACKQKAKPMEKAPRKLYRGLAVLNAGAISKKNLKVIDSRHVYCGHGDIKTGIVTQRRPHNVPRDPHEVARVKAVASELVKLCQFYPDPNITSARWEGSALLPPSAREAN